ncbi:acyltransferase [Leptospira perolatii]|uniref:Acyltransferase n=1 Tax=Leptospira perolatii TaxID=2023191 RepID=A0A2M9ZJH5_9LEPT|nr:acyltransferase [Leptospira perolatii]PJZ72216.1 acyltransferase [Leptospira perolatii]
MDYLDNLRSFALLLGLAFHVAIVYAAELKYPLRNDDRSVGFDVFGEWVHLFRMPLFFFLSGYFSERTFRSKGFQDFLRLRGFRIIIPLFSGVLLFAPMQYYIPAIQNGYTGSYLEFFWYEFLAGNIRPSHLWFLLYLVLYTFLYVGVRPTIVKFGSLILPERRYGSSDISALSRKRWEALLILSIWSTFWTCLVNYFFLKDDHFLTIEPVQFIYDLSFFTAGAFFIQKENIFLKGNTNIFELALLGFCAILVFGAFFWISRIDPFWSYFGYTGAWRRILHLFLKCLGGWLWISFFVRLFQSNFYKKNDFTIYLRESSLPVYLLHHPISLSVGYMIVQSDWQISGKFLLHLFLTYFLTFSVYHLMIRDSKIWNTVLGNAKPKAPPVAPT